MLQKLTNNEIRRKLNAKHPLVDNVEKTDLVWTHDKNECEPAIS